MKILPTGNEENGKSKNIIYFLNDNPIRKTNLTFYIQTSSIFFEWGGKRAGSMLGSVIQATERPEFEDSLKKGLQLKFVLEKSEIISSRGVYQN